MREIRAMNDQAANQRTFLLYSLWIYRLDYKTLTKGWEFWETQILRSSLPPLRFLSNKSKSVFAMDLLKAPRNQNPSVIVEKSITRILFCHESTRRFDPLVRSLRFGMGRTTSVLEDIVSCLPLVVLLVDETLFRRVDAVESIDGPRLCGDANLDFLRSPEHCWIVTSSHQCFGSNSISWPKSKKFLKGN